MGNRPPEVSRWLSTWSREQREGANWLAERVHTARPDIAEAIKWGRLTFTVDENWHHWLCAVSITKRAVRLMFHKGALLEDPAGLMQGEGRYLRHVPYDQATAHPEPITDLVRAAIAHQTDLLP